MSLRGDTRRGVWGFLDRYPFSIGVPLTFLALFLYAGFRSQGYPVDPELPLLLGANDPGLLRTEPWRLLTSVFLHFQPWHLAFNVIAIVYWGRLLEIHFGSARLFVLFCACALVASAGSAGWQEVAVRFAGQPWGEASVGASGAAFGLLFLGLITAMRAPERLGSLANELRIWIGVGFILAFLQSGPADHAAHLGGSLAGIGLGYLCFPEPGEDPSPAWGVWAVAAALAILLAFGRILWLLRDWQP